MKSRRISRRFLGIFCLALVAALPLARAWGYHQLGPDRVLLMNNDTNIWNQVSYQGYNDTDQTKDTYWVHSKEAAPLTASALKAGRTHTLYRSSDGTVLWHLQDCRAGSATSTATTRNYISWSVTAESISTAGQYGFTAVAGVGSVALCNSLSASLYSPCLEGIGGLYFDAVNAYVATPGTIGVELATNVIAGADADVTLYSTNYDQFAWFPCPVDLLTRTSTTVLGKKVVTIAVSATGLEDVLLEQTRGGDRQFYRIRANVFSFLKGYRGPVRFRIVRKDKSTAGIDNDFLMIDNIVASYPPMTAEIHPNGMCDETASGADVIGYAGTFSPPLLSIGQTNVLTMAHCTYVTNEAEPIDDFTTSFVLSNAHIVGRWRYLNQHKGDWHTNNLVVAGENLYAENGFTLPDMVGDWEFYFTADQSAPHYFPVDYVIGSTNRFAYGNGWTEEITNIVCHASYPNALPSGGTDWFTRIREGASDYAYISLVGEVTTNGAWGANMHSVENNERTKMELVSDHTWRYHYYIPTNAIGEHIRFHFEGVKYATNDVPFVFNVTTNVWYANSTNVPYLPYTMAASGSAEDAFDAEVELDGSATHLQIEFNDEKGAFALSRGAYQNFNMWTDANDGYRGDYTSTTGVSDVKHRWDAAINDWSATKYANTLWREPFEVNEEDIGTGKDYEYYKLGAWKTPNGWSSENSMYVPRYRIAPYGLALQLSGKGEGSLMLNTKDPAPNGIGTVDFAARVAQIPMFNGFCYDYFAGGMQNYAVSAKVTMSRLYDTQYNPLDISPANPSVSLIGYYQGTRNGCYEFRVTRSGDRQLTVALYRWKNEKEELLVENVLRTSGNATLAAGQTALGVGGSLTSAPDSTSGKTIGSFNNLLVPMNNDDARLYRWTCMCLSLYSDASGVHLNGYLSPNRNTSYLAADSGVIRVVAWLDDKSDALKRGGSSGVGSVGCQAGFGMVYTHDFLNDNYQQGIDSELNHAHASVWRDWDYPQENWRPLEAGEFSYGAGFTALIPTNQTVKLFYSKLGKEEGNWVDSGWETCVAPDYLVRLQTGPGDAEIVIDSVEVRSWRASDTPNLSSKNGQYDAWAYTMASIETAADIEGAYDVQPAGTNGYAFIFNEPGVVSFTPKVDMVIDRALLVGGGGAGGWTLGGGGGGGGVLEYHWEDEPATVPAGTTIRITVGAGGDNFYKNNNDSGNWKAGGNGGLTRVDNIPGTGRGRLEAKGGGGGAGWNQRNAASGNATGGGAAQGNDNGYYSSRATGTSGQGNSGGRAYGDRAGGGGGADLTEAGMGLDGNATDNKAGDGGAGRASDITGTVVYYGGGGGGGGGDGNKTPNSAQGGLGGRGGGGKGPPARAALADRNYMDGTDGLGGGGAGGSHSGAAGTNAGGRGGCGCVILRVRTAAKLCVLQPTKSYPADGPEYQNADYPMSIRSKWLDNGLSLFSFSYRDADSNAVLRLQISTNLVDEGVVYTRTREPADSPNWTTLTNWSFKGLPPDKLKEDTLTYFLSLRAPHKGLMRLVMDPAVVTQALLQAENRATRNLDYGKITVTRIFCYDEPELDARSWWGWNLHTEGWNGGGEPGRWAYLTDSPSGLSCSLNFSALVNDNKTTDPDTYGIGLGETGEGKEENYKKNNPFVQSPEMTNGIASVSFRARTFETNATKPSVVILYGSKDIGAYQAQPVDGQAWTRLAEFVISNNTYQTYNWRTNDETWVREQVRSIRLEVGGARNGRNGPFDDWEKPMYEDRMPIQRVFLDEVSVSEPVGPRLKFFDVRPFRDELSDMSPKAITNINDRAEQPLLREAWGIQARVEPQQMADELDLKSLVVKMAAYVGTYPWGYENWKSIPVGPNRFEAALTCVDTTNLIFRSTYDNPASMISPVDLENGASYAVVQYYVWVEYKSKDATEEQEPTTHKLTESEWVMPEWYWPKDFNREYGFGENFSAFTILDTVSPGRAWLNEVNYNNDDYNRDSYQFLEFMVPEGVDLTGWSIRLTDDTFKRGFLAELGSMGQPIYSKEGRRYGIDSTNQFTVMTFVAPNGASLFSENESDGTWNKLQNAGMQLQDGSLKKGNMYELELVRPSGVVEHQIVVSGTNMWAGSIFESKGDATNFVNDVKKRDFASEVCFWAGEDRGGMATADKSLTLGVWRGHGEQLWDGGTTWTNDLTATPGELNLRNGQRQVIDQWMLRPNGSYVWIDAIVNGTHTLQYVDGNPDNATREKRTIMMTAGTTTNIRYKVDAWYEMANCTTNDKPVESTEVPGLARTFEIVLPSVSNNITVIANDRGDSRLFGTNYPWQVAENDPYRPAILDWLLRKYPDKSPADIAPAEQWDLAQTAFKGYLDLKAMYWLDIPPTAGHDEGGKRVSDWRLLFGYTKPFTPFPTEEDGVTYANNAIGAVKLLLTNKFDGTFHPPFTIQGLQPGSSSATDYASMSENWTSATFKVTCALNYPGQNTAYKPVKWFVFDEHSFDANGVAWIEVPDQSKKSTPGFNYGWSYYFGTAGFLFNAKLDDAPSGLYSTEILRAVHTNSYNAIVSP